MYRLSAVLLLTASVLAVGCGESDTPSASSDETRELFVSKCGTCHTLSDAETVGDVGPNLDLARPDAERVAVQIEMGGGAMPPKLLEGEEATAVAEYVAEVAGGEQSATSPEK